MQDNYEIILVKNTNNTKEIETLAIVKSKGLSNHVYNTFKNIYKREAGYDLYIQKSRKRL